MVLGIVRIFLFIALGVSLGGIIALIWCKFKTNQTDADTSKHDEMISGDIGIPQNEVSAKNYGDDEELLKQANLNSNPNRNPVLVNNRSFKNGIVKAILLSHTETSDQKSERPDKNVHKIIPICDLEPFTLYNTNLGGCLELTALEDATNKIQSRNSQVGWFAIKSNPQTNYLSFVPIRKIGSNSYIYLQSKDKEASNDSLETVPIDGIIQENNSSEVSINWNNSVDQQENLTEPINGSNYGYLSKLWTLIYKQLRQIYTNMDRKLALFFY